MSYEGIHQKKDLFLRNSSSLQSLVLIALGKILEPLVCSRPWARWMNLDAIMNKPYTSRSSKSHRESEVDKNDYDMI